MRFALWDNRISRFRYGREVFRKVNKKVENHRRIVAQVRNPLMTNLFSRDADGGASITMGRAPSPARGPLVAPLLAVCEHIY
jgi:hypothetical protein